MADIQTGIRSVIGKSARLLPEDEISKTQDDIHKSVDFFNKTIFLKFPKYFPFLSCLINYREGSGETPPHKFESFKFKDYCPLVFRHLRQKFNIDQAEYMVNSF
jgi:hypothetical protein